MPDMRRHIVFHKVPDVFVNAILILAAQMIQVERLHFARVGVVRNLDILIVYKFETHIGGAHIIRVVLGGADERGLLAVDKKRGYRAVRVAHLAQEVRPRVVHIIRIVALTHGRVSRHALVVVVLVSVKLGEYLALDSLQRGVVCQVLRWFVLVYLL